MRNLFICISLVLLTGCFNTDKDLERDVLLNEQWRFHLGDIVGASDTEYSDHGWRLLDLPHDWAIEGAYSREHSSGTGYLPGGVGWYRKRFTLPEKISGKTFYLLFEGAYQNSEVWINGHYLGKRPYGYSSFYYPVTDEVKAGDGNLVAVRLDHKNTSDSRWYTGNGIYRNVWLISVNHVHIKPWGTSITTPVISSHDATINIKVDLQNSNSENAMVTLISRVLDKNGKIVAEERREVVIQSKSETSVSENTRIEHPQLWSPELPYMYSLESIIKRNNRVIDRVITPFGVRSVKFNANNGFTCNGKPYLLKGVCLHHDFGPLGAARHPGSAHMVLKKLKSAGVNAIRTAHNPEAPHFLTMADTMGFFVQEEAFDEWHFGKKKWIRGRNVGREKREAGLDIYYGTSGYSDFFDLWAEDDLKDMIRRDRNHPSIVMWSIGNEIDYPNDPYADSSDPYFLECNPDPEEIRAIASKLSGWIKEIDSTRFVTAALANIPMANTIGYTRSLDITGYNYQEKYYQDDHRQIPDRIMYGSENAASRSAWEAVLENDFISGQFIWTGMDYRGEAGEFPMHSAGPGLLDLCGNEKPIYYERKSWWTEEPMVKLFVRDFETTTAYDSYRVKMHWNFDPGEALMVGCFTNCDEAELFLNGESQGKKNWTGSNPADRLWRVPYRKGKVKITGYKNGVKTCEDSLETAGSMKAIRLGSFEKSLTPDGFDVVHVSVQAEDEKGVPVPFSDQEIRFEVYGGGKLMAVGNGDLSSLEPNRGNKRRLHMGRAMVIIQSDGKNQDVTLIASHGSISNQLSIPTRTRNESN